MAYSLRKTITSSALPLAWFFLIMGVPIASNAALAKPLEPGAHSSASGLVVYGGLTSKGGPVFVQAEKDGGQIVRVVAAVHVRCAPSGGGYVDVTKYDFVPVSGRGAFKALWTDSAPYEGGTLEWTESLTGKVNRKRTKVTGTYRNIEVQRRSDGSVMDTCDSGPLRFSATR